MKDVCDPCGDARKYEHLEPTDGSILLIPELPKMRELQTLPPNDRLALMYLHITIIERTMRRSAKEYMQNVWDQGTKDLSGVNGNGHREKTTS